MELNEKTQEKLHDGLGNQLLALLFGTPCDHCGRSYPAAKDLTVIRQFLADNGTTGSLRARSPLHRLSEAGAMPFAEPDEPITRPSKKIG